VKNVKSKFKLNYKETENFHFFPFRHLIPECGDLNTRCPMFGKYCEIPYMSVNGLPIRELCPYTCGLCPHLPPPTTTTTTTTTMITVNLFER
jgi:hypothetical protein